jgi:large subunit ribosomal protein L31
MKAGIHPELKQTKVHCNGCNTDFETTDTVENITVDICSNCHPFYTGKQKLVDTAGRVEKFKARAEAAKKRQAASAKRNATQAEQEGAAAQAEDPELQEIAQELKAETVETPAPEKPVATVDADINTDKS